MLKFSTQLLPVLCWAADNRLFYAYRDNPASEREDSGIWWVRVNQKSGELEGKPVQLTKGAGRIGGLSVSRGWEAADLLESEQLRPSFLGGD